LPVWPVSPRRAAMIVAADGRSDAGILVARSMPTAAVIIVDRELRVVHAEGAALDQHGSAVEDWSGRHLRELLSADALVELEPRYRSALEGVPQSFEYRSQGAGSVFSVQITPVRGRDGALSSVVAVMQDITDRLRVSEELSQSEARLRESERLVGVGSWELVPDTGVITYSNGLARLLSLSDGEALDLPGFLRLVHGEDHAIVSAAIAECLRVGSASCEVRILHAGTAASTVVIQGETVAATEGRATYLRGAMVDVTDAREAEGERLAAVSLFRHGFDGAPIGMGLTDPTGARYVRVNDALCRLLDRSRQQLMGGTIDAMTHPDDRAADDTGRQAMLDRTVSSFEVEKRYLLPDGGAVWTMLHVAPVRNADGSVQAFFSQIVDITERKDREERFEQSVNDAVWLGRIRDAIDDDRLVLYRQPIVDLRTGETVQHELLLRIRGEDGSIIAPGDFLPVAERYGLISEIDRWVLRQAVKLAAQGESTEFNLSAASIDDPTVLRELASAIQETGADPSLLVLEVTETAMMNQLDAGRRFAVQVAALGCQLALDDFGTGFASLSYLKQIPARLLKIDVEFVRELTRSETDERLVRGIIGIAREFEQTTIAEGIEDEATLVRLRELGVHLGQGYLFGRPEPIRGAINAGTSTASPTCHDKQRSDAVSIVRSAFDAYARRDVDGMLEWCHPDIVLRPYRETSELTGREAPYRGYEGVRAYVRDITDVWTSLELTPTAFRSTDGSVIVFGRAETNSGAETKTVDVLWVWRLRDGLVDSVAVFESALPDPGQPARMPRAGRRAASNGRQGSGRRASDEAVSALAGKFARALQAGSSAQAEQVMDEALLVGLEPAAIHALVIEPAMEHIGELWASDSISVADEHLATAISHEVLVRLFDALHVTRTRSRELVLLAAVEGQRHLLGLRMVADVLEGAGFDVLFLGADVPLDALRGFVAEHQPAVVGLGFGIATNVSHLAQAMQAIHEVSAEPRIMLGGRAVPPGLRDAGYPFVPSSLEAVETVQRLLDGPPQTLSAVVPTLIPEHARGMSSAHEPEGSDPVAQRLVDVVAESSDLAREYVRQARALRDLALRDPVTGLANRRAFDDQIYLQTHEDAKPGVLMMIDVDDFKQVNDTYGHEAGDRTLRLVAEAIADSIRPQDFAARIGGDEFAAILPVAGLAPSREAGERVRRAIAATADPSVTVSIGLAPLAHDARAALLAADQALYEAKSTGRDQVFCGSQTPVELG
jgi:diguanylate cyclase (GGDEF)-like protein/PAS domain S-box-containing protein